jgi:hypothetical protein
MQLLPGAGKRELRSDIELLYAVHLFPYRDYDLSRKHGFAFPYVDNIIIHVSTLQCLFISQTIISET